MIWVSKSKSSVFCSNGISAQRGDRVGAVAEWNSRERRAEDAGSPTRVRIRLPTYLYSGIPPARAAPGTIIREPKTASASPSTIGATISGRISGAY